MLVIDFNSICGCKGFFLTQLCVTLANNGEGGREQQGEPAGAQQLFVCVQGWGQVGVQQ